MSGLSWESAWLPAGVGHLVPTLGSLVLFSNPQPTEIHLVFLASRIAPQVTGAGMRVGKISIPLLVQSLGAEAHCLPPFFLW